MTYNMTFLDGNVTISGFMTGINTGLGGFFGLGIVALVWFAVFISLKNYDSVAALMTSSFISLVIGGLFWGLNIIEWQMLFLPFLALLGSVLYMILTDN